MTGWAAVVVVTAVAAGSVAQVVTGLGFSLVCAPFVIAALGPHDGVRTAVALSLVLNVGLLVGRHRQVMLRPAAAIGGPAVLATPILAAGVSRLDARPLGMAAGILILASVGALATGLRWPGLDGPLGAAGTGVVSAAMNVVASIAGPPVAVFAVNAGWPPAEARATLQAIFAATNVVAVASLGLPVGVGPVAGTALVAALGLGWLAGLAGAGLLPHRAVRTATLALAAAGGVAALTRALW